MLPASDVVNGLRMALLLRPDDVPGSGKYTTTAYLENCTDHEIIVLNWEMQQQGLRILDNDGNYLAMAGGVEGGRLLDKKDMYDRINAGQVREYTLLNSRYRVNKQATEFPDGSFDIEDRSGFFRHIPVNGSIFSSVQAVLDTENEILLFPENSWRGIVKSPLVIAFWDLTYFRQQRLQASADDFEISLNYQGAQDKPFYSLRICSPSRVRPDEQNLFHSAILVSAVDAPLLFTALAKEGILRAAYNTTAAVIADGYQMNIYSGKKDHAMALQLNMASNLGMLNRLSALQQALPVAEREKMTPLITRFSGMRAQWESEQALQQRITLSITGQSIAQATAAIVNAAGGDKIPLQIDDWMRDLPQPDLTFVNISAEDALLALAESADISCVIRQGRVIIRPFLL